MKKVKSKKDFLPRDRIKDVKKDADDNHNDVADDGGSNQGHSPQRILRLLPIPHPAAGRE